MCVDAIVARVARGGLTCETFAAEESDAPVEAGGFRKNYVAAIVSSEIRLFVPSYIV